MCGLTTDWGIQDRAVQKPQAVCGCPSSKEQGCAQEALSTLLAQIPCVSFTRNRLICGVPALWTTSLNADVTSCLFINILLLWTDC